MHSVYDLQLLLMKCMYTCEGLVIIVRSLLLTECVWFTDHCVYIGLVCMHVCMADHSIPLQCPRAAGYVSLCFYIMPPSVL